MIYRKQKNITGYVGHSGDPLIKLLLFLCTADAHNDGNDIGFFYLYVCSVFGCVLNLCLTIDRIKISIVILGPIITVNI